MAPFYGDDYRDSMSYGSSTNLIYLQLYERRKKVLFEGEDKERFKCVSVDLMSDESSGGEDNTLVVHQPIWRSKGGLFILCL